MIKRYEYDVKAYEEGYHDGFNRRLLTLFLCVLFAALGFTCGSMITLLCLIK